jgi:hypothetical protein
MKPLKRHVARGMSQGRKIWIDPRTPWPHHVLLHELIHVENPSWSETRVSEETTRRWKVMTWRQKAELLQLLGSARVGENAEDE